MSIALIGGIKSLERRYIDEAWKLGLELKVFNGPETRFAGKIKNVKAFVIFTNKVSHRARKVVMNRAKTDKVLVLTCHSCGISTLRECLGCIKANKGESNA